MGYRTQPPERFYNEEPGHFIRRLADWLAEPHRRRLGEKSHDEVYQAIKELEEGR